MLKVSPAKFSTAITYNWYVFTMANPRIPTAMIPHTAFQTRKERVIDARICILSGCRYLQRQSGPDGNVSAQCGASVFKAELPYEALEEQVRENPDLVPGSGADDNPFLLRLLMSPDCVRPECGVAEIEYQE